MRKCALFLLCVLGLVSLLGNGALASPTATVPSGFEDTVVATLGTQAVPRNPTALAFVSPSRMLITLQTGELRVYQNGVLLPNPALDLSTAICSNSERGLLGVAVDPNFATNHFIYLYYTLNKHNACPLGQPTNPNNPVNRVSRFVLSDANTVDKATELVLIDNMISPNGNHNGGDLHFGADGYLYASVGDGGADYAGDSGAGGQNDASRDQFKLLGKILRITRDGNIPPDNPFLGAGTASCRANGGTTPGNKCQETFAWGLRNPFRFAMKPGTSQLFINDVGQSAWEEIDAGQKGADYGWSCREGRHANITTGKCSPAPANMIDPIFEYPHGVNPAPSLFQNCDAITGGAFVPAGIWPAPFTDSYLFGDYICGKIFKLTSVGGHFIPSDFASSDGVTSLTFGPYNATQALYYTTFAGNGQIRRIVYVPGSNPAFNKFTYLPLVRH